MKKNFIYPTKKNMIRAFIIAQLFPIIVMAYAGNVWDRPLLWLGFESVILGMIALWELKPREEFDEREKDILLKWKDRSLTYVSYTVLIPIITLSVNPAIEGWTLYGITSVPAFHVLVFCALMYKREMGMFFIEAEEA